MKERGLQTTAIYVLLVLQRYKDPSTVHEVTEIINNRTHFKVTEQAVRSCLLRLIDKRRASDKTGRPVFRTTGPVPKTYKITPKGRQDLTKERDLLKALGMGTL